MVWRNRFNSYTIVGVRHDILKILLYRALSRLYVAWDEFSSKIISDEVPIVSYYVIIWFVLFLGKKNWVNILFMNVLYVSQKSCRNQTRASNLAIHIWLVFTHVIYKLSEWLALKGLTVVRSVCSSQGKYVDRTHKNISTPMQKIYRVIQNLCYSHFII